MTSLVLHRPTGPIGPVTGPATGRGPEDATMVPVAVSDDRADEELVAATVAGDRHAFGLLMRRHDPTMRRLASSMVDPRSSVDDVLQTAYLKAFRALASYRGEAAFSTWLYRIVFRACQDHRRRRRPDEPLDDRLDRIAPIRVDPFDQLVLGDALRRALSRLSPEHRAIVVLVDGEGYSYDEAAEILGVRRGTVGSRLNRARSALREAYEAADANPGGGR